MIDHERALELAATELDFKLSPADDAALTAHLETCEPCRLVSEGLRGDAVALVSLEREDAPDTLRARILDEILPSAAGVAAQIPETTDRRPLLRLLPPRFRQPAMLAAAAAVIVAVIGGTLAWRAIPSGGEIAVVQPTNRPSLGPGSSGGPGGSPGPTNPPGPLDPGLVTAWAPVADLTAEATRGGVVDLDSGFVLAARGGTSAAELASHLTVRPQLTLTTTIEADGRVLLTPAEPLTPGAVYRFTLAGDEGQTLDTWAFQARQPLHVVSTLPESTQTGVPLNTGIDVTFDQDGVIDAAAHMTIEPSLAGRFEQHDRVLSFVPDRLAPATIYTVTITRGVTVGSTGEALEADVRFQFETAAADDAGTAETTFRFATDLFESATADRPTISLWSFTDAPQGDEAAKPPDSVRLEVYRLPDMAAAIGAFQQLRAFPRWSEWNSDDRVPTTGLTRVARLDAHLEAVGGTLWTRLPERLPAGWYLVEYPSPTNPAQAILQVTDIAGYLVVSETQTLVWANDLASGKPIAEAAVAAEGAPMGRTSADGTLIVETPPGLLHDPDASCEAACDPVVTVSSGARTAFLPATGANSPDGRQGIDDGFGSFGSEGHAQYWKVFNTDRLRYRRTDTINAWGMLRDRDSGKVPETVTLRLVISGEETIGSNPPLVQVQARPRPTGAFTASLDLQNLPEGGYLLELVVGGTVVDARFVDVGRILKPAYRLEVVTGRRIYIAGDRIRVTAKASFYEGTPVPGVPLRINGAIESSRTTDATGTAVVRGTARIEEDYEGPSYQAVYVQPARAEEGEIGGATREFIVFPSMWTIGTESEIRGGRVRLTGGVNVVDRDRLETEVADGTPIWELDPRGAPVRGRTVTATFTEIIPVRTKTGTTYDFIEKRVVPVYRYDTRELTAGTLKLSTDDAGRFSGSVRASDEDHDYRVRITITDPDGHTARSSTFASQGLSVFENRGSPILSPTDDTLDQFSLEFGLGDKIDLTMREPDASSSAADDDRHLFYVAQRGLREATVRPTSRFVTTFPDWGAPDVEIGAVRFTGAGYAVSRSFGARFRSSDREITVDLQPDKARYAPGDDVTLGIRTRDADGRALPATVVLRAVDEKLFTIGAAVGDDPLSELYVAVGDGIRATYATHRAPPARPEGAATAGGDDNQFRDAVLFQAVDTGADGRGSATFPLSRDLTSWRVNASAIGGGLEAGAGVTLIPVGLPFFVDAAIAPEYLLADRPAIQLRGFGSALDPDARVTFEVDADSLGLHESGLRAAAFKAVTVPLPALKLGTHSITITARTGSGASARSHRLTRSFTVVASRLTRTRTSYTDLAADVHPQGGDGLTDVVVSDASSGRELPRLLDLASGGSVRLERALAADLATSLIAERFGAGLVDPSAATFDPGQYQVEDGGIAILPYASSDLEISALVALVAPDRVSGAGLRTYFRTIADSTTETRERRNFALAGLAGLGAPVLPDLDAAAADPELTIRERLMLGLAWAALGDTEAAHSIAVSLASGFGESVGDQARLRVGDDTSDVTAATALMAMLMAATGDPVAPRYRAYVDANPSLEAPDALFAVGYAARMLDHSAPEAGSFAYEIAGKREVVALEPGETFHLSLTKGQLADLSIQPVEGTTGVTTTWREPVKATAFEKDPDVTIARTVKPTGNVAASDLVIVDLAVTFGPQAAAGCHRVIELVPSGLVPVSVLHGVRDPESGELRTEVTYPEEQTGQRVIFCAQPDPPSQTVRLRYVARVITLGTYEWEPTVVESRSRQGSAAIVPAREITIR